MASITIRNLDETLKQRLRVEAARHGHSMEEEVRLILRGALDEREPAAGLGTRIRHRFADAEHGGFEAPARQDSPQPADLGE